MRVRAKFARAASRGHCVWKIIWRTIREAGITTVATTATGSLHHTNTLNSLDLEATSVVMEFSQGHSQAL